MTLARMQWRQFFRGDRKSSTIGLALSAVYMWMMELMFFFILKDSGVEVPVVAAVGVIAAFLVVDFIIKLFFQRDNTVMDASLKTRPVPQREWRRFLGLSQFWSPLNLEMPLVIAPACFLFLPAGLAFIVFPTFYLASVLGGFLVMLIKHRGDYQPEKMVSTGRFRTSRSETGGHIFGLQTRSLKRSKRLRTSVVYMSVLFYLQYILYSFGHVSDRLGGMFVFYFILLVTETLPQWGFAIEANCFQAIWTKPVPVFRILEDKFRMSMIMGVVAAVLCLPVSILSHSSVADVAAYLLFSVGFGSLSLLLDAPRCTRLDLFGKTFFNYQGSSGTFKGSSILALLLVMTIGIGIPLLLPGWKSQLILSVLGAAGLAVHRRVLRKVEEKFLKDRYRYMEKFNSI